MQPNLFQADGLILGQLGAIVGTIFGIQALSAKSDFDDHPTTEAADDVERNAPGAPLACVVLSLLTLL